MELHGESFVGLLDVVVERGALPVHSQHQVIVAHHTDALHLRHESLVLLILVLMLMLPLMSSGGA